jgi:hypothetical protein
MSRRKEEKLLARTKVEWHFGHREKTASVILRAVSGVLQYEQEDVILYNLGKTMKIRLVDWFYCGVLNDLRALGTW